MKYIEDYTTGSIPGYKQDITVVNFTCTGVRQLERNQFRIQGRTIDKDKVLEFVVDKNDTSSWLFAPGYVFTIWYYKTQTNSYHIVFEQVYRTALDCRSGIEDIKFNGEENKALKSTPYNTVSYFEAIRSTNTKKIYGKQQ